MKICLTCQHWKGDRDKQLRKLAERGDSCAIGDMSYPEAGVCDEIRTNPMLEILESNGGHFYGTIETDSTFACSLWARPPMKPHL